MRNLRRVRLRYRRVNGRGFRLNACARIKTGVNLQTKLCGADLQERSVTQRRADGRSVAVQQDSVRTDFPSAEGLQQKALILIIGKGKMTPRNTVTGKNNVTGTDRAEDSLPGHGNGKPLRKLSTAVQDDKLPDRSGKGKTADGPPFRRMIREEPDIGAEDDQNAQKRKEIARSQRHDFKKIG